MFPGANAQVYRNEAGEPIGWDYPSYGDDYYDDHYENWEVEFETAEECIEERYHARDGYGENGWWVCDYCNTPYAEMEVEDDICEHGLSAWLCEGLSHYPMEA